MRNEIIKKILSATFGGGFIFAILTIGVFAQTENEKPRIKDFGSSLRKSPAENDNRVKAQNKKAAATDDETIRVETNLVVSEVLVLDKKGRAIRGLKKEDFVVAEDKQPQEIGTFALGDDAALPRSIVLIIDYSGSQLPYIERSVNAAKVLVDKLGARDRMAIVTDDVELLADFTGDKELLKEKLESLKKKVLGKNFLTPKTLGRSRQMSALYAVLNEVFDDEDARPIIIFQGDGDEIPLLKNGFWDGQFETKNFSLDDVLTATEKSRATIYSIIPGVRLIGFSEEEQQKRLEQERENRRAAVAKMGMPPPRPPNLPPPVRTPLRFAAPPKDLPIKIQTILAGLAKFSGGWADFLETPEQANDVYTRILSGINSRYVIGYYPTNEKRDGTRRTVKIEVRGHPEYIIWGRKTYFAPEPEK